jgi:sugar phosphate permease
MVNQELNEEKNDSGIKEINWLNMVLLSLGAGTLYLLPYMRNTFYDSLQLALGVPHTQLGLIQGFFGFLMLVCYFSGGFIADRFPTSKLLFVSFMGVGLGGLYFSTFPSVIAAALCVIFCLLFRRTALARLLDEGPMTEIM